MTPNPFAFLLLVLAVYRLSLLIARDEWPFAIMTRFRNALGKRAAEKHGGLYWTFYELLSCPLCNGIWLSAIFAAVCYSWSDFPVMWLAIAGAQTFLVLLTNGGD